MNILEFRKQYPEYNDMSDQALADSLYQKHYADMDRKEFDAKFLAIPQQAAPAQNQAAPNLFPVADPMAASLNSFNEATTPQLVKDLGAGIVNQLPVAGMMAGGGIGGLAGPLGAVAGAGLGGGIGAAGKGLIQEGLGLRPPKSPMENWQDIGKEAAMGAGAEMAGPIVAKGIGTIMSPFAGRLETRMAADQSINAAQGLVEKGAPISPDVIMDTQTSKFMNWLAEKIWPANSIMANQRGKLQGVADALKEEFVTSRGLYNSSKGAAGQAWDNWVNVSGGPDASYAFPKTQEVLSKMMEKPFAKIESKGSFWTRDAATLQQTLKENNGEATIQNIRDMFNTLNPTSAKGADRSGRMAISNAINDDLLASGRAEMVEALEDARKMTWYSRKAESLRRLFDRSMIKPSKPGDTPILNPASFVDLWNTNRGKFLDNKFYSMNDIKAIDAFADKMKALVPDLSRAAKYNPPTSLSGVTQLNLENPLAVGGSVLKYPGLAVPVGMDMMLAHSLMSPTGVMRKFLTTGFAPPTLSTKAGIMAGMEAAND